MTFENKNGESKIKMKLNTISLSIMKTTLILLFIVLLNVLVMTAYRMDGNYMYPSVRDGDLCLLYKLDPYYLNDVVLYKNHDGERKVGRIVAVEDQEISFDGYGSYQINGYVVAAENMYDTNVSEESQIEFPLVVEEGEYFVLNDYRSDTSDSREVGTISESQIEGKLFFLFRRREF